MTIASEVGKVIRNGNGVATSFSFAPMAIFKPAVDGDGTHDLEVTFISAAGAETILTEGTGTANYSVSVVKYPGEGSITYPASGAGRLATGEKLVIKRKLALLQPIDLENQGGYFPDTLEEGLDRPTMILIQQQEEINRAIKVPIGSTQTSDQLLQSIYDASTTAATQATNASNSAAAAAASAEQANAGSWVFDDTVAMADPGTGDIRLNNAAPASATAIAISALTSDTGNPNLRTFIASWDDSTNTTIRGTITLRKVGAPAVFAVFNVTGALVDNTTWLQLAVTYVTGAGAFALSDKVTVDFSRAGDKGADGAGTVVSVSSGDPAIVIGGTAQNPTVAIADGSIGPSKLASGAQSFDAAAEVRLLTAFYSRQLPLSVIAN